MDRKIKSLLVLNGIHQNKIASSLSVTGAAVCRVISGKSKSRRIQEEIARLLNMDVDELWEKVA